MSNHEFENYLALVSRLLRLNGAQKEMIRDELHDHLENRVSELVESGWEVHQATRRALEEFGDATVLAQQFQIIFNSNQKRWMMRFATFSIAGVFAVIVLMMSLWPSPARFGSPDLSMAQEDPFNSSSGSKASTTDAATESAIVKKKTRGRVFTSENIYEKLSQPSSMDYDDVAFMEIMDELSTHHGFNIILDQSARDDSLTEDELITIRIKNTTLATALRLMLLAKNATYVVDSGVLLIISMDVADDPEFHCRRIFDCRQLLAKIAASDKRVGQVYPQQQYRAGGGSGGPAKGGGVFCVPMQDSTAGGFGGGGGGSPNSYMFAEQEIIETGRAPELVAQATNSNSDTNPKEISSAPQSNVLVSRVTAEALLIELVKSSIAADSWDNTNGDGTLSILGGLMVVTQSQNVLEEIEEFLIEFERRLK